MSQSLSRHVEDIQRIVTGLSLIGDEGAVDVLYDGDTCDRRAAIASDVSALVGAGYRARVVGRNRMVAVDLANVGDHLNARFVK